MFANKNNTNKAVIKALLSRANNKSFSLVNIRLFSKIKIFGFFSFKILTISKNKVPLVSSKPLLFPAILNGWHGNPAQRIS